MPSPKTIGRSSFLRRIWPGKEREEEVFLPQPDKASIADLTLEEGNRTNVDFGFARELFDPLRPFFPRPAHVRLAGTCQQAGQVRNKRDFGFFLLV